MPLISDVESAARRSTELSTPHNDWLHWQLADSAFPSGGFAHSSSLEAAWQHGEVQNFSELASFLESSLEQLGHSTLPFVIAAYENLNAVGELDHLCDCFLSNHVANRASRLQGRSFLSSCGRIFPASEIARIAGYFTFGHFAPSFGAASRTLGLSRTDTARLFFFQHLRGLMAAAVRLGIVGPMKAQELQHRLTPHAQSILSECMILPISDIAQTEPLLELWQGTQDRLYSRLFQS